MATIRVHAYWVSGGRIGGYGGKVAGLWAYRHQGPALIHPILLLLLSGHNTHAPSHTPNAHAVFGRPVGTVVARGLTGLAFCSDPFPFSSRRVQSAGCGCARSAHRRPTAPASGRRWRRSVTWPRGPTYPTSGRKATCGTDPSARSAAKSAARVRQLRHSLDHFYAFLGA